ncbi:MAG: hypothetical protein MSC31_13490 [Solirubrobacteraceae bacterium MAG38_C4-C5]|nr:hypothetical protein [Candidatus Siliceabacter maunaloa]
MDDAPDRFGPQPAGTIPPASKAERRAARQTVNDYHAAELARLLDHPRDGFARWDAGDIDAFELDDLIHQYKRASQQLWSFCTGTGAHVQSTARTLAWMHEQGETTDWWAMGMGAPRRR